MESFDPKKFISDIQARFGKCKDSGFSNMNWNDKFIHLWFMDRVDKKKMIKTLNKLKYMIENNNSDESYEGILAAIKPFSQYLDSHSFTKLPKSNELFK